MVLILVANAVPVMMGTVSEEALFFIYEAANGTKVTESLYILLQAYLFQSDVVEVWLTLIAFVVSSFF